MNKNKIPASNEAEISLLGSCLLATEAVALAVEQGISSSHFFSPAHKSIWVAIEHVATQRSFDHVNATTVINELKIDGSDADIGGIDGLIMIMDATTTPSQVASYIDIVEEKYLAREFIKLTKAAQADVLKEEEKPRSLMSRLIEKICCINKDKVAIDFHAEHIRRRNLAREQGFVGYRSGLKAIDHMINSYIPPDNVVIAGKSSEGKTDLLLNKLIPHALDGVPIGIYSTDMDEYRLRERIVSYIAEVNTFLFGTKYWKDEDADKIDIAYAQMKTLPIYICDKSDSNINDIISKGVLWSVKHGVKLFAMDFLQQLERSPDQSRLEHRLVVGQNSGKIKALGKRFDLVTFCLSQISRYGEKTSELTPSIPNKEALKEAGEIENNADIIEIIAKDPGLPIKDFTFEHKTWMMTIRIAKARNGPTGDVAICYVPSIHKQISRQQGILAEEENKLKIELDSCQRNMQM